MNLPLIIAYLLTVYILLAFLYFSIFKKDCFVNSEIDSRHSSIILGKFVRKFWFWLTNPIVKILIYFKIKPNYITVASLIIMILAALLFATGSILIGGLVLAIAGCGDYLDGRVARKLGMESKPGVFLDSCLDRYSEGIFFLGLFYLYRDNLFLFLITGLTFISSIGISYVKAKSEALGIKNDVGIMQRPERLTWLSIGSISSPMIIFIVNYFFGMQFDEKILFEIILILIAFGTFSTSLKRLVYGFKVLEQN
jgi:phosphatidylglycerophosphate synthase